MRVFKPFVIGPLLFVAVLFLSHCDFAGEASDSVGSMAEGSGGASKGNVQGNGQGEIQRDIQGGSQRGSQVNSQDGDLAGKFGESRGGGNRMTSNWGTASEQTDEMPFSAIMLDESGSGPDQTVNEQISVSRRTAITRAVEKASPSIVSMLVTHRAQTSDTIQEEFFRRFFGYGPPVENQTMGSGFIISEDGLVVTNQHVIGFQPAEIMITTIDGKSYPANLIGSDELTDLALLQIQSDEPFSYVEFSDSDEVLVGEWAIALGNPFALFEDGMPTVTVGVISAKNRDFNPDPESSRIYIDMIQTDAAINRGNSGGPLLNANGEVIGINTFIFTGGTSAGFVGLGFAIPSNRIESVISQLLVSGSVVLDYDMGMEFSSMTRQLIYRYQLPRLHGLLVTSVNQHGPAYESGILPGDVILKVGDQRVVSKTHALALMREYREGDRLPVTFIREQSEYDTNILLRKKMTAPSVTQESSPE